MEPSSDSPPVTSTAPSAGSVASSYTSRGQNWSVEVRAFDGEDEGPPAFAWRIIENAAPGIKNHLPSPVFDEDTIDDKWIDLSDAFEDPDGDPLTRSVETTSENLTVSIDPDTGKIDMLGYGVVGDFGVVVNPMIVAGQMHGGIAQGAGQILMEQVVWDAESGQLLSGSFMDYAMPRADEYPRFAIRTREVPTKANPLGVKGVGEAGTVGAMVATINAVCDALKPLGISHFEMPATPDRVWAAIAQAKTQRRG